MDGLDPYDFYLNKALNNEEMRIASQELNISKTELKLVKGNYLPTVHFLGTMVFIIRTTNSFRLIHICTHWGK
ncbi:TolC family protein [Flavobacterium sp. B183]|uniref:TolC family protein n=1 Tax=Flavobacterium sp. B183 TaxID=907046 RepID=UPI00201EB70C|nr:TolC family protein [Flavobacterium sp. B183]URC14051.1 TolC family protein [Flavobacterium sp. B183]